MSETLINWPDACVFCGDSNGTIGRTANDHWKQFKCGTEYEVVGEKTAWIQDDDCKIAALMEELAAEKQQRQAAEEETKRWMELAEHQAIGRDKLGTDLAAATKRADDLQATITRIAEAQRQHCTTECIDGVWWAKGNGIVAGPQVTEQEVLLEVAEMGIAAAEQENARMREVIRHIWVHTNGRKLGLSKLPADAMAAYQEIVKPLKNVRRFISDEANLHKDRPDA